MASTMENEHAWEMVKENTMPIKRGRNPSKTKPARGLRELQNGGDEVATRIQEFEESIRDGKGSLSIWIKHIKWMQDRFPNGSKELLPLFERCTREFSKDPAYRNDERYIKIWIGYADMLPNPSEVFKYMRTEGIGEKLALYYVATAWTAERRKDFSLADKAYKVGLEKKAKPTEMLRKRHREFQRRMSRYLLNQVEAQDVQPEVQLDENNQPLKPARANRRLNSQGNTGVSAARKAPQQVPPKQFNVFTERTAAFKENDWEHNGNAKIPKSRGASTKENTRKPTPWVNQGLVNHVAPTQKPAPPKSFGVFIDEDSSVEKTKASNCKISSGSSGLRERATKGKSAKSKLTEAERLRKHPLENFKNQAGQPKEVKEPAQPEAPVQDLDCADEQDLTINTKLAFQDMFEMFASPSMKSKESCAATLSNDNKPCSLAKKAQSKRKPFVVFEQGQSPEQAETRCSKPFAIFSGEEISPVKRKSTAPFAIHEDSAPPLKRPAKETDASNSKVPFAIHQDKTAVSKSHGNKRVPFVVHTDEAQAVGQFKHLVPLSDSAKAPQLDLDIGNHSDIRTTGNKERSFVNKELERNPPAVSGALESPSEDQENENLPKLSSLKRAVDPSRALAVIEEHEEMAPEGFSEEPATLVEDIVVFADNPVCQKAGLSKGLATFDDDDDLGSLPVL